MAWQWVGSCLRRALSPSPRLPHCFNKRGKDYPSPALSIPLALRNSSREEELEELLQAEQSPLLFLKHQGSPEGTLWIGISPILLEFWSELSGLKLCAVHYFFFSFLRKKEGWRVVKHFHSPQNLYKAYWGLLSERKSYGRDNVPASLSWGNWESSSWWKVDEREETTKSAAPLAAGRMGVWKQFNCRSPSWPAKNSCYPTRE